MYEDDCQDGEFGVMTIANHLPDTRELVESLREHLLVAADPLFPDEKELLERADVWCAVARAAAVEGTMTQWFNPPFTARGREIVNGFGVVVGTMIDADTAQGIAAALSRLRALNQVAIGAHECGVWEHVLRHMQIQGRPEIRDLVPEYEDDSQDGEDV